jgi:hypothetical protein
MELLHSPNPVEHWENAYNQWDNKETYVCHGVSSSALVIACHVPEVML